MIFRLIEFCMNHCNSLLKKPNRGSSLDQETGYALDFCREQLRLQKQLVKECTEWWQFRLEKELRLQSPSLVDRRKVPPVSKSVRLKQIAGFDMQTLQGDQDTAVGTLVVLSYPSLKVGKLILKMLAA